MSTPAGQLLNPSAGLVTSQSSQVFGLRLNCGAVESDSDRVGDRFHQGEDAGEAFFLSHLRLVRDDRFAPLFRLFHRAIRG